MGRRSAHPRHRQRSARRACDRIRLGPGQPGLGQAPGHSYGIGEFSLEDMLDSFTQRKNVTVNLNTPRLA
jgi:hypothetical protein